MEIDWILLVGRLRAASRLSRDFGVGFLHRLRRHVAFYCLARILLRRRTVVDLERLDGDFLLLLALLNRRLLLLRAYRHRLCHNLHLAGSLRLDVRRRWNIVASRARLARHGGRCRRDLRNDFLLQRFLRLRRQLRFQRLQPVQVFVLIAVNRQEFLDLIVGLAAAADLVVGTLAVAGRRVEFHDRCRLPNLALRVENVAVLLRVPAGRRVAQRARSRPPVVVVLPLGSALVPGSRRAAVPRGLPRDRRARSAGWPLAGGSLLVPVSWQRATPRRLAVPQRTLTSLCRWTAASHRWRAAPSNNLRRWRSCLALLRRLLPPTLGTVSLRRWRSSLLHRALPRRRAALAVVPAFLPFRRVLATSQSWWDGSAARRLAGGPIAARIFLRRRWFTLHNLLGRRRALLRLLPRATSLILSAAFVDSTAVGPGSLRRLWVLWMLWWSWTIVGSVGSAHAAAFGAVRLVLARRSLPTVGSLLRAAFPGDFLSFLFTSRRSAIVHVFVLRFVVFLAGLWFLLIDGAAKGVEGIKFNPQSVHRRLFSPVPGAISGLVSLLLRLFLLCELKGKTRKLLIRVALSGGKIVKIIKKICFSKEKKGNSVDLATSRGFSSIQWKCRRRETAKPWTLVKCIEHFFVSSRDSFFYPTNHKRK